VHTQLIAHDALRREPVRVHCLRNSLETSMHWTGRLVQVVRRDVAVGIGVLAAGADATLANVIQVAPVVGVLSSGVVCDLHVVFCAQITGNGASSRTFGTGAFSCEVGVRRSGAMGIVAIVASARLEDAVGVGHGVEAGVCRFIEAMASRCANRGGRPGAYAIDGAGDASAQGTGSRGAVSDVAIVASAGLEDAVGVGLGVGAGAFTRRCADRGGRPGAYAIDGWCGRNFLDVGADGRDAILV
jgi:hypothetical protein